MYLDALSRFRTLATLFLCLFACGCENSAERKFDPEKDFEKFKAQLDYSMEHSRSPMEISDVKVLDVVEVSDEVVRISYSATGKYFRNSFVEVNRAAVLKKAGWDEERVRAAAARLRQLPEADAKVAEELNPLGKLPPNFYRKEGNVGDVRQFEGSCSARRKATKWAFENWDLDQVAADVKFADASLDISAAFVSNLPPNALLHNSDQGRSVIAGAVAALPTFVSAVDAAEKQVLERELKQFHTLQSLMQKGRTWIFPFAEERKPVVSWSFEVIASEQNGELVRLLARHPSDENRRRVYEGRVLKAVAEDVGPHSRPRRHPPQIVLHHSGAGPSLFYIGEETLKIKLEDDGATPRLFTNNKDAILTPGKTEVQPVSEQQAHAELMRRLEPGTQWNGSVTMDNGTYENVIFTVTDRSDDGRYLRVVAESVTDPYTIAVFEGTFDKNHVHGWPIVIQATHGAIGETKLHAFFNSTAPDIPPVVLALHDAGFVGTRGNDKIFLTTTRKLQPWTDREEMIASLFAQGARFSGRMQNDEATTEVVLTIAEIRNDSDYVRVIAQLANEPQEIAIYEGRRRKDPEFIDGYSLDLTKRQSGTTNNTLFSKAAGTMLSLRLALDNSAVFGIVRSEGGRIVETVKLARLPSKSEGVSMATPDFSALLRQKFAKGAYFRGTIKDVENKRTFETTLRVMEATGDGLTVELTSNRAGSTRAVYQGILRLDDAAVNGYSVQLEKTEGTAPPNNPRAMNTYATNIAKLPPSPIFDQTTGRSRTLQFALSYDGETLLGMPGGIATTRQDGAGELLSLRSITTNKPGALKVVPIVAAPKMPVLSGESFRPLDGATTPATPAAATAAVATTTGTPAANAAATAMRTWRSGNGKFTVEASFVGLKGDVVLLKQSDGKVIEVAITQLSAEDQEIAKRGARGN